MANNQRKMTRSMSPGGSPAFQAPIAPRGMKIRNTAENRATKRAAKKQIKTREERAWREDSSSDREETQS